MNEKSLPSRPWLLTFQLGWGLLRQFSPFRYFPHFPLFSKEMLAIEYHVYIWQVSPQLSCGDTCQTWMWFRESNRYFCKIENFAYGEISERSFSNPHPWAASHGVSRSDMLPSRGPFHWNGLILIPIWISNYIHSKVWDDFFYPFPNFNGCTVEIWEWIIYFTPLFIMDVITYHADIQIHLC